MPDFVKMTSVGKSARHQDSMNKPFDEDFVKNPFSENFLPRNSQMNAYLDKKMTQRQKMTNDIRSALSGLKKSEGWPTKGLISESEIVDDDDQLVEIVLDGDGNVITDGEDT